MNCPALKKRWIICGGIGIEVIVHTILGLPGESRKDILETMEYLNHKDIQGIKLQLLHVLKGTDLAYDYSAGKFKVYERDEYLDIVTDCLEHLRPDIVINRYTVRIFCWRRSGQAEKERFSICSTTG